MIIEPQNLEFVIFDCDGVIIDTNRIKSDGFVAALEGQPAECIKAFLAHHHANGGVSRFIKFERYFTEVNSCENPESAISNALAKYADYLAEALPAARVIKGAKDLLKQLNMFEIASYMISGGVEAEVRQLIEHKGLKDCFEQILGSPKTKFEHITKLKENGLLNGPGFYFGDGSSDWQAAKEFGIPFCFVSEASEWKDGHLMSDEGLFPSIPDLSHIEIV